MSDKEDDSDTVPDSLLFRRFKPPAAELKRPPSSMSPCAASSDSTSSLTPLTRRGVSSNFGFQGGGNLGEHLTSSQALGLQSSSSAIVADLRRKLDARHLQIRELEEDLKLKRLELSQTRGLLEIVEGDKEAHKQQEKIWRDEVENKIKELERLEKEKREFLAEIESLRQRAESDSIKIRNLEEELAQTNAMMQSLRLEKTGGASLLQRPAAATRSSFPQLLSGDPFKNPPVASPPPSSLANRSEETPEIRWHPKEDVVEEPPLPPPPSPSRRTLAEDQYAPLQAWLRKQKMEAAFSGAYAVQGAREQTKAKSLLGRGTETRYLECPKCDKRFNSRDFSAYRRHLEDCLT